VKNSLNKNDLINFENDIALSFKSKKILSPIHLYYGNEDNIIKVFKKINPQDWIFCSWRSHYQCLLKGVPPKQIKSSIFAGKSISLCFPKYRIYSSAMVAGSIPIAVGTALSLKIKKVKNTKVYCFMGEMTSETGVAHESIKYSRNFNLPIHFVIEDNKLSVCTDTRKSWNQTKLTYEGINDKFITYYKYKSKYPHAGVGERIQF
jgi:pyruvate dehydrogenase E1 component alpha subunit